MVAVVASRNEGVTFAGGDSQQRASCLCLLRVSHQQRQTCHPHTHAHTLTPTACLRPSCSLPFFLQSTELPAYAVLSSAALGGIAYWLAIFPVDVIKSSMQTDSIIKGQRRYTDILSSAKVGRGVKRDIRCLFAHAAEVGGGGWQAVEPLFALCDRVGEHRTAHRHLVSINDLLVPS